MQIGRICNPMVIVAQEDMTVADAARLMREQHVGSLVIVQETGEGKVVRGILTDRDIVVSVVACDLEAQTMTVGDIMQDNLVTVSAEAQVADALHLMRQHGVRRIPVVSERGILQGIVTADDALAIVAEELNDLVGMINREQQREHATRK